MKKTLMAIALAIAVSCLFATQAAAVPLTDNVDGYYKFGYTDGNTYAAKVEKGLGAIKVNIMPETNKLWLGIIIGEEVYFVDGWNRPRWGVLTQIDEDTFLVTSHDADTGESKQFTAIRITEEEANEVTEANEVAEKNAACERNMRMIGSALHKFAREHNEELPYNLSELYPDYIDNKNIFVCPARGGEFHDFDSDYEYIPGFRLDAPNPDQEAILVENQGNHKAPLEFHSILFLDRHIEMRSD